jgi:hypothetical protein
MRLPQSPYSRNLNRGALSARMRSEIVRWNRVIDEAGIDRE